jgi:hypothetical protein
MMSWMKLHKAVLDIAASLLKPELTHVWQGYPTPSYDLSHQEILTSCGREEIGGDPCGPRVFGRSTRNTS